MLFRSKDANFDADRLVMLYNTELANDLGNLCNRSINMTRRYCDSVLPSSDYTDEASAKLQESMATTVSEFCNLMDQNAVSDALEVLNKQISACNAYIELQQPWQLAKDDANAAQLHTVLRHLLESCAQAGFLIKCILPEASHRILSQLNALECFEGIFPQSMKWGVLADSHTINEPAPIFPRILSEEEKAKLAAKVAKGGKK